MVPLLLALWNCKHGTCGIRLRQDKVVWFTLTLVIRLFFSQGDGKHFRQSAQSLGTMQG
jgi:hypothetical protein